MLKICESGRFVRLLNKEKNHSESRNASRVRKVPIGSSGLDSERRSYIFRRCSCRRRLLDKLSLAEGPSVTFWLQNMDCRFDFFELNSTVSYSQ